MVPLMKRMTLASVMALGTLAFSVLPAFGQNFNVGNGAMNPLNQGVSRIQNQIAPTVPLINPYLGNPYTSGLLNNNANPYSYGYSPYQYGYDPYGGVLRGAADLINAQGQLMVNQQQAYIMREQARAERFNNKRRALDEYLYEREKTPTAEEERQRFMQLQLQRSRNNPTVTEVWSGKALNDILADLRRTPPSADASLKTFQVPLDDEGLKKINVISTKSSGNVGLLKNGGKLSWPIALDGLEYKEEREHIGQLMQEAVKQAEFTGKVDNGLVRDLKKDVDALQKALKRNVGELPVSTYIEGKNYLNNLDAAITALTQRDIGNYFTGKYDLRGKTVSDLVKYMNDNGLMFAPAVPGDENAYLALHQALAGYSNVVSAPTSRQ